MSQMVSSSHILLYKYYIITIHWDRAGTGCVPTGPRAPREEVTTGAGRGRGIRWRDILSGRRQHRAGEHEVAITQIDCRIDVQGTIEIEYGMRASITARRVVRSFRRAPVDPRNNEAHLSAREIEPFNVSLVLWPGFSLIF